MIRSPAEIDETDLDPAEFQHASRQRSARTDASMRDGNSAHGNPEEDPEDELSADNDIGDTENDDRGRADLLEMIPDRHGADGIDPDAEPDEDGSAEDSPALMRRSGEESAAPKGTASPVAGYDKLKIPEIVARAEALSPEMIGELLRYEGANRNRKTLVAKLNNLLKPRPVSE